MAVASNEHERQHDAEAGMVFNTSSALPRTMKLWQFLLDEDTRQERKRTFPNVMTKRQRKRAARTLLRGFATTSSAVKSNFRVNNLFSYERRFSACSKLSSDSESAEVEDLQRNQQT